MTAIGLVLGAGGVLGGAYHAGALAAVRDVAGWDARDADLVVGTSAGSIAAAGLRAGLGPGDHLATITGGWVSPEGRAVLSRAASGATSFPSPAGLRLAPPANLPLAARALLPFGGLRPGVALAGMLPAGQLATEVISGPIDGMHGRTWPSEPTWIVAVRLSDGARVVFGRDEVARPTIGAAAAASSSIPGFFRPVTIDGTRYVDGGVHSPTNADLCAGLGFDLVVVVSPMSGTRSVLRRLRAGPRVLHARALSREVRRVRAEGTPVLTIQPSPEDEVLLGANPMDPRRRRQVAQAARRTVRARLESDAAADRLALLRATGS